MLGIDKEIYNIFKGASNTFFYYSLLFKPEKRQEIFDFYAFVRTADEFVDNLPQDIKGYQIYKAEYYSGDTENKFIKNFLALEKKYNFKKSWADRFFHSLDLDTFKHTYETQKELDDYLHGISEVIGLYIAVILQLDEVSYKFAKLNGRAMQYANIIRDIGYDLQTLGRVYIPQEHIRQFGLTGLTQADAIANFEAFKELINFEANIFFKTLKQAQEGYKYIPRVSRIPVKSAADIYSYVIKQILSNPMQIYYGKVKPFKLQYFTVLLKNSIY